MSFVDKQLVCRDCGKNFIFTGGEQEFYASKGLQNEPVRCPSCRSARKANRLTEPEEGYVRYGVFASFGGRTPRQMHPATCADCGMMTEVPFQPRGDRPVYCSACYNKIKGNEAAAAEAAEAKSLASSDGETADEAEDPASEAPEGAAEAEAGGEEEAVEAAETPEAGVADADAETSEEPAAEAEAEPAVASEAAEAEEAVEEDDAVKAETPQAAS